MLEIADVDLSFGGIKALRGVGFTAETGSVTSVIGPNGAGKTSLFNVISGFYRPQAGTLICDSRDITRLPAHRRTAIGIARTFQTLALYEGMNVLENIKLGAHPRLHTGIVSALLYFGPARREEQRLEAEINADILDFLDLRAVRQEPISALSFGLQRRVELARALASRPKLLLLDEPVAGMNLEERAEMVRFILAIKEHWNVTILLVEHDMNVVMDISDKVVVFNFGEQIAEGSAAEVQKNDAVIEAYLGAGAAHRAA